jgi:hypothetical protein
MSFRLKFTSNILYHAAGVLRPPFFFDALFVGDRACI